MQSSDIRATFLDFFTGKGHLVMPSFSLIPQDDPSLLLIGAGMAPLKPFFTGERKPPIPVLPPAKNAYARRILSRLAIPAAMPLFSRCSATSLSAITLKKRPLPGPGSWSGRFSACRRSGSGSASMKMTMRLFRSGGSGSASRGTDCAPGERR